MNKTIVPTKNVSGRINIFLNNLTFNDALDVILISQDLASEKRGDIINIMTSAEYEKLYGRRYNEKRELKTLKLSYAKPQTVFAALGQIKSDIGKVIVDEASGTIFLIDIPEKVEEMSEKLKELDRQLETKIFHLKYAGVKQVKEYLATMVTSGIGEVWADERTNQVAITDLPDKIKKITRIMNNFDVATEQVFIEVSVLELSHNDEFQRAIDWEAAIHKFRGEPVSLEGAYPSAASFTPAVGLSSDYSKLIVGDLGSDKYTLTLQMLETLGKVRLITHSYLSLLNKEEGRLLFSAKEPIVMQTLDSNDASTVIADSIEFVDVGLILKVKPEVNGRDFITLRIATETSVLRSIEQTEKTRVPIVGRNQAETMVKVKDKNTIMIAGFKDIDSRDLLATHPLAHVLPEGSLSGQEASRSKTAEYLVFITPTLYGRK